MSVKPLHHLLEEHNFNIQQLYKVVVKNNWMEATTGDNYWNQEYARALTNFY